MRGCQYMYTVGVFTAAPASCFNKEIGDEVDNEDIWLGVEGSFPNKIWRF